MSLIITRVNKLSKHRKTSFSSLISAGYGPRALQFIVYIGHTYRPHLIEYWYNLTAHAILDGVEGPPIMQHVEKTGNSILLLMVMSYRVLCLNRL